MNNIDAVLDYIADTNGNRSKNNMACVMMQLDRLMDVVETTLTGDEHLRLWKKINKTRRELR